MGRWGFTRQPENSKRAHLRALPLQNTKIPRTDPKRGKKGRKNGGGRGKKNEILGFPPCGKPPFGLHPSAPTFSGFGPHPFKNFGLSALPLLPPPPSALPPRLKKFDRKISGPSDPPPPLEVRLRKSMFGVRTSKFEVGVGTSMFDFLGQTLNFEVGVGTSMFDLLGQTWNFEVLPLPPSPATHCFINFFSFFFLFLSFVFLKFKLRTWRLELRTQTSMSNVLAPPPRASHSLFFQFFSFFSCFFFRVKLRSQTSKFQLRELHGRAHLPLPPAPLP